MENSNNLVSVAVPTFNSSLYLKDCLKSLLDVQIIDEIIKEPLGGAHRDKSLILQNVKDSISKNLENYKTMSGEEILNNRKNKFLRIGRNKGFIDNLDDLSSLKVNDNNFNQILKSKKIIISLIIISLIAITSFIFFL